MRILYYYPEVRSSMFQWQRVHFMDELSRYGHEFDVFNPLEYNSLDEATDLLIKRIKEGGFDLFFTNLCNKKHLYIEPLLELQKKGIPSVSFRSDNLIIPFNDKSLARYFDIVWITSIETQRLYEKWGAKLYFAPYAANPFSYSYNKEPLVNRACFIGSPYGSRPIMMNRLTRAGVKLDVFCGKNENSSSIISSTAKYSLPGMTRSELIRGRLSYKEGRKLFWGAFANRIWGEVSIENNANVSIKPSVSFEDLSSTYSSYNLSIAYTSSEQTDILRHPLKIIDLRNFEIPMCGGVEICRFNKELASYFEEGKEIIFYNTNEELVEKAKYYTEKATEAEIRSIKEAARIKAEKEHNWHVRFMGLFQTLGLQNK